MRPNKAETAVHVMVATARAIWLCACVRYWPDRILVPRGRAPFGQHQESRPLAKSNTGSPRFTDFPSLCACSESSLTNLIGSGLNLLCLLSHSKTECRWTRPEVAILGADQKERGLWAREWPDRGLVFRVSLAFIVLLVFVLTETMPDHHVKQ